MSAIGVFADPRVSVRDDAGKVRQSEISGFPRPAETFE
jgi:hypothetical protein